MSEYQNPKDLSCRKPHAVCTEEAAAFFNLKHTAERKDGAIPAKYRELMSVAVALTTQCAYCVERMSRMQFRQVRLAKRLRKRCLLRPRSARGMQSAMVSWQCVYSTKPVRTIHEAMRRPAERCRWR